MINYIYKHVTQMTFMKTTFKINSLAEEKKRIEDAKKYLDFCKQKGFKVTLPIKTLEEEYSPDNYTVSKIIKDWKNVEKSFFNQLQKFLKMPSKKPVLVRFTKYGTGGTYRLPNIVTINVNNEFKKIDYKTISHEIIHLAIEKYIKKNNLNHEFKEELVKFIQKEIIRI